MRSVAAARAVPAGRAGGDSRLRGSAQADAQGRKISRLDQARPRLWRRREEGPDRQGRDPRQLDPRVRSEEHTSELQSLMRISYAVFCLKKKKTIYSYV